MDYSFHSSLSKSNLRLFAANTQLKVTESDEVYSIIWNTGRDTAIEIDGIPAILQSQHILTLTPSHNFEIREGHQWLIVFQFNEGFYCVGRHDNEVSCIGYLFYGSSNIISIAVDGAEQAKFKLLLDMFIEEFGNRDNIQGEMLTALLKRLIIQCTRLAKVQQYGLIADDEKYNLVKQFNVLVEMHFRQHHNVAFYAKQLHKSPKTLANVFAASQKTPVTIIHNRIITEAIRQLLFSGKSVKEIAYELNFTDIQSFSRFFKAKQGVSPTDFRKSKIANPSGNNA